jgi:mannose/fructose/N-acetylgalactosamine-specific phosphotransferase system component IIB
MWVRIDNRLVHGQTIEAWVPHIQAKEIWVVNEELFHDPLRQEIMSLAIPQGVEIRFFMPATLAVETENLAAMSGVEILILFASCGDARLAHERGFEFETINIANIHYGPGKTQLCDHVAVNADELSCLAYFDSQGVSIDFRCVPNRPVQVRTVW